VTPGVVVELELPAAAWSPVYAHLLRTLGDLRPGVKVRQGQLIGLAGHSGKTATDRVRLELRREQGGEVTMLDPLLIARGDEGRPPIVGAPLRDKAARALQGRDGAVVTRAASGRRLSCPAGQVVGAPRECGVTMRRWRSWS
jgi:hypothetical protein